MVTATETQVAGRELDAAVAWRVMGFDPHSNDIQCVYHHPTESACAASGNCRDDRGREAAPHYSTDLSASWEVIKAIVALGYDAQSKFGYALYEAADEGFDLWDTGCCGLVRDLARLTPAAICRAALEAVDTVLPA